MNQAIEGECGWTHPFSVLPTGNLLCAFAVLLPYRSRTGSARKTRSRFPAGMTDKKSNGHTMDRREQVYRSIRCRQVQHLLIPSQQLVSQEFIDL